jgi:exodeoxyribonuclease VII large subunit
MYDFYMKENKFSPNVSEYTVSELSTALKATVEDRFGFVRVRGEVSDLKLHSSGHCYLSLKDDSSLVKAIVWRTSMRNLNHQLESGMEIIACGRLTTYAPYSSYQLIIESFELEGEGALLKILEHRRKSLESEGLFATELKKDIPLYPSVIGVVTSSNGSVIRDILHRLRERFPTRVLVWPVPVQGESAAHKISEAINGFNSLPSLGEIPRPDLLIIARGGGSLEDLWAFNEEVVVRAAAESNIPLISAIGHETDTTLIDFAADLRAPTPTAAAELSVPVRLDLIAKIREYSFRMDQAINRSVKERLSNLIGLSRALPNYSDVMERRIQDVDRLAERLIIGPSRFINAKDRQFHLISGGLTATLLLRDLKLFGKTIQDTAARSFSIVNSILSLREEQLTALFSRLESVSHLNVINRGYVIIQDTRGIVVTKASGLSNGSKLVLGFSDGQVEVTVNDQNLV